MEFCPPSEGQRREIWANCVRKMRLSSLVTREMVEAFAHDYAAFLRTLLRAQAPGKGGVAAGWRRQPNLAPGDFRTVRQSFWYFGDEVTDAERVDALAAEAKAKAEGTEAGTRRVGF